MYLLNDPLGIFYINWYKSILYENCYFTDKDIFLSTEGTVLLPVESQTLTRTNKHYNKTLILHIHRIFYLMFNFLKWNDFETMHYQMIFLRLITISLGNSIQDRCSKFFSGDTSCEL